VAQDSDDTNGSGGAKGNQSLKASVGLNYMINVPNDNAPNGKSHGLLVLLHGSGASNFREFVRMMSKVATEEGLIPVSVQAPNGRGWNEGNQNNAAELLHRLLQEEILPKYNVNKRKIVFSGQSSGGGFLSSHFVPLHADDYEGGAFLQCGAAPPQAQFRPSDATKKRFRLHFEITSGDPIWPQSYRRAVAAYEAAGMQVSKDESKRGGHCSFDQQQVIRDHIRFVLGET
jgi:predicted peptidase